jgi:hypothetical protein
VNNGSAKTVKLAFEGRSREVRTEGPELQAEMKMVGGMAELCRGRAELRVVQFEFLAAQSYALSAKSRRRALNACQIGQT